MILPGWKVEKWNDSLYVNKLIYSTFVHVYTAKGGPAIETWATAYKTLPVMKDKAHFIYSAMLH